MRTLSVRSLGLPSSNLRNALSVAAALLLAACSSDPLSPSAPAGNAPALGKPAAILYADEGVRVLTDSVDAAGNTILVQEFGIGYSATGTAAPIAGVVIKSVIPYVPGTLSSSACITHSIMRTEITAGNTLSVKKSGGCDKDIEIAVEQKATRLKATFRFSMVFGKTVIDSGVLR